ncbi:MAG: hypothetical protein CFE23_08760 [Flavobacterium sp. BFFFF1]|uniref:DUF4252 domain-containing protein n=1 Tax=unclassified Flavobacterium TaxID=196869 RepID=UPI000BDD10D2|nr:MULTISPECIES: DUF4252 domain-containing protein [unclassified Flavobacterium]OYU80564.1 MAG: hypothetical protein CFE23_08760 [Flavobacterium sp. BFFFF1]
MKTLKKLILCAALIMPMLFFGQSAFDKFDGRDDITAVIVNKKMFQMMGKVDSKDKETQQYLNLIQKLDNLRVFTTTNDKTTAELKSAAEKYIKTSGLEELMRVNDKGKNIRIMIKSGAKESQVRELLMFIEGSGKDDTVLMSLTGDFDLNEISILTDKMNLPGGDVLSKGTKGRK